jgi:acyl-CoA dehydrogenase
MILHSPFYDSAHEAFRDQVRRFVRTEIEPHVDDDEAGAFPRALYRKAAQVGLLQLNYPEELGGVPADRRSSSARNWRAAVRAECARR